MDGLGNIREYGAALSTTTPIIESGAGTVGVGTTAARADHVHPAASSADFSVLSGDVTATAGGAVTLANPFRLFTATFSGLNATTILGNTAGTLAHAQGVTVLAGVASKRICVHEAVLTFTFNTAAYTGGGNVALHWNHAGSLIQCTNQIQAASSLGAANDDTVFMAGGSAAGAADSSIGLAQAGIGKDLVIRSSASFTQPGTAAGTAVLTIYYFLASI